MRIFTSASSSDAPLLLSINKKQMRLSQTSPDRALGTVSLRKDTKSREPQVDMAIIDESFSASDTIKLNVPEGNSCKVVFSDGSIAYLHPGSILVYPHDFDAHKRNVHLEGEAYFQVKKDMNRPFTVYTDKSQTLVTGTEFDVTAQPGQDISVTLVNGSVQFSARGHDRKVLLLPGQQVYGVGFVCHNPKLLNYRMHLFIHREKELSDVVTALNRMKKVNASIKEGKLYIE